MSELPKYPDVSLQEAFQVVQVAAKAERGPCESCERTPFSEVSFRTLDEMLLAGWKPSPTSASYFKRCEACAGQPRFPWAERLDVERVRNWMRERYAKNGRTVFAVKDLEVLT